MRQTGHRNAATVEICREGRDLPAGPVAPETVAQFLWDAWAVATWRHRVSAINAAHRQHGPRARQGRGGSAAHPHPNPPTDPLVDPTMMAQAIPPTSHIAVARRDVRPPRCALLTLRYQVGLTLAQLVRSSNRIRRLALKHALGCGAEPVGRLRRSVRVIRRLNVREDRVTVFAGNRG